MAIFAIAIVKAQGIWLVEMAMGVAVREHSIEKLTASALTFFASHVVTRSYGMMLGVVDLNHREGLSLLLFAARAEIEVCTSCAFEASAHDGKGIALVASHMTVREFGLFLEAHRRGWSHVAVDHLVNKMIVVRSHDLNHGVWLHGLSFTIRAQIEVISHSAFIAISNDGLGATFITRDFFVYSMGVTLIMRA